MIIIRHRGVAHCWSNPTRVWSDADKVLRLVSEDWRMPYTHAPRTWEFEWPWRVDIIPPDEAPAPTPVKAF